MDRKPPPARRRRRTSGFVPRIKGNDIWTRCLEEAEKLLSPRRAGLALHQAVVMVGATPETVTLGHFVRAVDLTLKPALAEHCEPAEAQEIATTLAQVLDQVARSYFKG